MSLVFTLGCSVTFERNDWEGYTGPGAEYYQTEEFSTPQAIPERIEPVNRTIAVMNHGLIVWIVDPIARVYRFILPRIVRTGLSNFGRNLAYPKHLLNHTLQWKWKGAGNETLRFLTNTTVGVGGLFDPATSWGIEPSRENFGRTLAKWGWDPLMYLMLPLFGPSTGREIVGAVGDAITEPQSYLFPAAQILTFNNLSGDVQTYRAFTATNYDPYELGRYIFTFTRWGRDPHYDESEYADEGETALQTLQTVLVEPQDPRFSSRARERSVNLPATGEDLRFSYWLQPEPAPVVYVLPGLGGHRESGSSSALAEMA